MTITINRDYKNDLYTEGRLLINGLLQTYTVEDTASMLPEGEYIVRIVKQSARKQTISIFRPVRRATGWSIGMGHSFRCSKKHKRIVIGQPLKRGAIYKATPDFERITDRLMKCIDRNENITLVISESKCSHFAPIVHWLVPRNHGCPPTKRRVEVDADGVATIYDGEVLIDTILPAKEEDIKSNES